MDEAGFAISTGSACSSNKKSRTRALEAMGIDAKTAFSSIRISQGPITTEKELTQFIQILKKKIALIGRAVR
jgi:cysteine desulfurase